MSADGPTRPPDAAPPSEPAPDWHPSEDRVRALERATLAHELREGPDYADTLLDEGGFTRGAPASPQVHDYTYEPQAPRELDGLSLPPADYKTIQLDHDLVVAQYFDSSKPLTDNKEGRSHSYWAPIDPADIPKLTEDRRLERTGDGNALLPSYGDRNAVQVAVIPAGTLITVAESAPQAEQRLIDRIQAAMDDPGAMPPELQPEHILENMSDGRTGGEDEIRFDHFDDRWIRGWAPVR